jgi:syntaxin 7
MAEYKRLTSSSIGELAELVKNFQTRIKKMNSYANAFQTDSHSRARYNEEREVAQRLSKSIISELRTEPNKPSDKLQQERLGKEFEKLLAQFNKVSLLVVSKEKEYLTAHSNDDPNAPHQQQQTLEEQNMFKPMGELDELAFRERDIEVTTIEHEMIEINRMFNDVAVMAKAQGIEIDKVEQNVDVADVETAKAVEELNHANTYQEAAKGKTMCIAVVVFIVAAVVVVVCLISL